MSSYHTFQRIFIVLTQTRSLIRKSVTAIASQHIILRQLCIIKKRVISISSPCLNHRAAIQDVKFDHFPSIDHKAAMIQDVMCAMMAIYNYLHQSRKFFSSVNRLLDSQPATPLQIS